MAHILIADDEPFYLKTTGELLRNAGYDVTCVTDAEAALEALDKQHFDLLLSDLNMPGNFKLELLHQGRDRFSHVPLIVITGVPSLPTAIESVRLGIADYLLKPVRVEDLLASVRRALRTKTTALDESASEAGRSGAAARSSAADSPAAESAESAEATAAKFPEMVGISPPMLELYTILERVARTDTNVLLTGESGTGKEVAARALHRLSPRREHAFQVIDCTAIPAMLFESVVFGHVKGSFTGAVRDQEGLLSRCHRGTAFLDELGELPLEGQAKLLRAIQEQTFTPVGRNTPQQVDTRFVCATNRDLQAEVDAGRFRADLFYRLGVIHIELPPLRRRGDDVILLAERFLKELMPVDRRIGGFSDDACECLKRYSWPGNIRELRNVVERAVALSASAQIEVADLPKQVSESSDRSEQETLQLTEISRDQAIETAERDYLTAVMQKHVGNIAAAARQAGLSRQGMNRLLKRHAIDADDYRVRDRDQ